MDGPNTCCKCGDWVDWQVATRRTSSYGLCVDCDALEREALRYRQAKQLRTLVTELKKRILETKKDPAT